MQVHSLFLLKTLDMADKSRPCNVRICLIQYTISLDITAAYKVARLRTTMFSVSNKKLLCSFTMLCADSQRSNLDRFIWVGCPMSLKHKSFLSQCAYTQALQAQRNCNLQNSRKHIRMRGENAAGFPHMYP